MLNEKCKLTDIIVGLFDNITNIKTASRINYWQFLCLWVCCMFDEKNSY